MKEEKCFCHLNGYAVKDATARKELKNKQNKLKAGTGISIDENTNEISAELNIEPGDYNGTASVVGKTLILNDGPSEPGGSGGGTKWYKHMVTSTDGMSEYIFYHYLPNKIYKDPVTGAIEMESYSLRSNPPLAVFYSYVGQPKYCAYNIGVSGFEKLYKFENGSFTEVNLSNFPTGPNADTVTEI